jgi:poly-gamma-glutamate synthesis protein (capsule biosynthesis protein)
MRHHLMSRRAFLRSTAAAGAYLLVACSGPDDQAALDHTGRSVTSADRNADGPSATQPRTDAGVSGGNQQAAVGVAADTAQPTRTAEWRPTVAIDSAVPPALLSHARWIQDRVALSMSAITVDGDSDLLISRLPDGVSADPAMPTIAVDYVAVVSRRLLVREIAYADLQHVWNGTIRNWGALGSPVSHDIVRVTVNGSAGPFAPDHADHDVGTFDDLADYMVAERGAIALIPVTAVDFRFRALRIDAVNVFRPGDSAYALQVGFGVTVRDTYNLGLREQVTRALASDVSVTPVSMTWAGDIIMGRRVHTKMVEYGDWAAPFRSIYPELTWADITVSNLECAISDSFETPTDPSTFDFKTDTPAIAGLQLAQIDVLSRANNHSFNFGVVGMDDTTAVLDKAGILHFGMGHNLAESRRATVVELGGTTYAFLGYNGISDDWDGAGADSPGTNPLLDWLVVEDIQREVAAGHVVIPFFHWGIEYVYDPTEEQRYFAQIAIDTGAAMVMGSHPHWVQAVETYKGKSIVYSLGNFVFDQEWSLETKQGMIADVWMQGDKVLNLDLVPVLIEDYHKPRRMSDDEAWPVLEHVWAASDAITRAG